jgi:hypothetical protein
MAMNFIHWLAILLAVFSVVPAVSLASPWKVPTRAFPSIMLLSAIVVGFVPAYVVYAMAVVGPTAYLHKLFGIEATENEAADYGPAAAKTKNAAKSVIERLRKPAEVPALVQPGEFAPPDERDDEENQDVKDEQPETVADKGRRLKQKLAEIAQHPELPAGRRSQVS